MVNVAPPTGGLRPLVSKMIGVSGLGRVRLFSGTATAPRVVFDRTTYGPEIGVVKLNRPGKLNALDREMFVAVKDMAKHVIEECNAPGSTLQAIVVHGSGNGFCAGLDVKSIARDSEAMKTLLYRPSGELANVAQACGYLWRQVPVPVICCIHGVCLGGGLQIALGADYRVATASSRLAVLEARWGIIPDMGISIALRELMPMDVAKEITMKGEMLAADEALAIGLVDEVVAADADVLAAGIAKVQSMGAIQDDPAHARRMKSEMMGKRASRFANGESSTKPLDLTSSQEASEDKARTEKKLVGAWENNTVLVRIDDDNAPRHLAEVTRFRFQLDKLMGAKRLCRAVVLELATTKASSIDAGTAHAVSRVLMELPVPVFAVYTEQFQGDNNMWLLTAGADFRYAHTDASLQIDVGDLETKALPFVSALIDRQLRTDRRVSGLDEAKVLGLVTHVSSSAMKDATKAAARIAKGSPSAVAAAKVLYNSTWHETEAKALLQETALQVQLLYKYNMIVAALKNFLPSYLHLPYQSPNVSETQARSKL